MGLFTQSELLLMIGVVSVLLFCITILTIFDIREYLNNKKLANKEIVPNVEPEVNVQKEVPVMVQETKNDEVLISDIKEDLSDDELFIEEIDDEPVVAIEEKKEIVTPEVQEVKIVPEEVKVEVEAPVIKKKFDLYEELDNAVNSLPTEKDDITNFELEQERTAIISLDELLKRSDELYSDNEVVQYDDGDEPITIDEVIKRYNETNKVVEASVSKEVPKEMADIVEDKKEPYSRKENIPFISSVYGIEKQNNSLEFENTASYEKLDRAKGNDFVAKLREMNENK